MKLKKWLDDCTINELDYTKDAWAYIEDYMFKPNGTLIILGTGYHTFERCGYWIIIEEIK